MLSMLIWPLLVLTSPPPYKVLTISLLIWISKGKHPHCGQTPCTEDFCCCEDPTKRCKYRELSQFTNDPGKDGVGTWRIDYEKTNSLTPTDPGPMHLGFSQFSTLDFNGHKNWTLVEDNPDYYKNDGENTPPWCRTKALYYHWATDEPKNFKAVGKSYN